MSLLPTAHLPGSDSHVSPHTHINDRLVLKYSLWRPAFPVAWTIWIAFLLTIVAFAAVQLIWLLISIFTSRYMAKRTGAPREEGYMMLSGRFDHDEESDSRARPRSLRLPSFNVMFSIAQYALCFIILILSLWNYYYYEYEGDIRYRPVLRKALADPNRLLSGYARGEKIFIAAAFHQNEAVLPYWTRSILNTIVWLGADNVFVSIVENYSSDRTAELLREFELALTQRGVRHRILIGDETYKRPEHMEWNFRIEYLAAIRDQILEPLLETGGYDKVLFSNDIFIEPESIIELIETRGGDFDFACG